MNGADDAPASGEFPVLSFCGGEIHASGCSRAMIINSALPSLFAKLFRPQIFGFVPSVVTYGRADESSFRPIRVEPGYFLETRDGDEGRTNYSSRRST